MKDSVAILLLAGFAQAALLNNAQDSDAMRAQKTDEALVETEELVVKMMEAVTDETENVQLEVPKASLIQKDQTQLGMFESGVFHSSMKPIVKAKVNKVVNYIHHTKDEYNHGTADQKKAIQDKAASLIMMGAGTRSFNDELCNELWSETTDMAGYLSFYYCPSLVFPTTDMAGTPPYQNVASDGGSRLRSGYLTQYFWNAVLSRHNDDVVSMMADHICFYWGMSSGHKGLCGKEEVAKMLPNIGWPTDTRLSHPAHWHCDATTCIAPIKAWAGQENFCLTTFGGGGGATEVIVPLGMWR